MLNLAEYRSKPHLLADYLPWACLIAPGVVLNKDGSFQRTARFRGPDLESATPSELVGISARLNNVLRRFGSRWALFFEAERHPARDYPVSDFPEALSALIDAERRAGFEQEGSHFESAYYLTFTYLPAADGVGKMERLFLEREDGPDSDGPDYGRELQAFIDRTNRAIDMMGSLLPEIEPLSDGETLTYLHGCISEKAHKVRVPDIPAWLDAILVDTPLTGGLEPMLGDQHIRALTIHGFPDMTTPGLLGELDHLGFSYRWVTRFIALDKAEAEKLLRRLRRQWFAKRKSIMAIVKEVMTNEQSVLLDTDADQKTADADAALVELGQDLVAFGYVTTTVTVSDPDPARADEKLRAVERVINGRGFTTMTESLNAVEAWLSSLPGHVYANVRQPVLHTLNLVHMMPMSAVWAGPQRNDHLSAPPLLMAKTGGATPFRLDLHQGDVGHTLVVGPTGAGKSVLLALLALQFRRYSGSRIAIFDKGASSKAAVLGMGGTVFDLGAAQDGEIADLAFQPLARIDDASERSFALDWVAGLLANENVTVDPEIKDTLWSALSNLASAPPEERTLTGLSILLQSNALKQALQPYTLDGPHGSLLDADEDRLALADVQCFEMEELMHTPAVVAPVLTYLFHRLEEQFDGKPTLLILDEAWVFLDHPAFAQRIREWLKTLRKKNVAVVFATQSLADIAESQIAPAIIESCPSRIFLPNDRAIEPQSKEVYGQFGLNDRQTEIIAQASPKREYYFQSRTGNRLFELGLSDVALAFCGASSADDQKLIDELVAAHGADAFADSWLRAKRLDWAADILTPDKENKDEES
ncbi:conjugal transfer protein TrbE [Erythrobacter aureus]|uniref:conjugal transfer protein TrbE n=1 Tax=Erythrobacter aureus TaxID=2182384 RepID=UPI003A906A8A